MKTLVGFTTCKVSVFFRLQARFLDPESGIGWFFGFSGFVGALLVVLFEDCF